MAISLGHVVSVPDGCSTVSLNSVAPLVTIRKEGDDTDISTSVRSNCDLNHPIENETSKTELKQNLSDGLEDVTDELQARDDPAEETAPTEHQRDPPCSGRGGVRAVDPHVGLEAVPRSSGGDSTAGQIHPRADLRDSAESEPSLITCPRCGALIEDGIDCSEAVDCAGQTDEEILAVYQPAHGRQYDLKNTFDRTNLAIRIRARLDRARDFLGLNDSLYRRKAKNSAAYLKHMDEALAALRRHQTALNRLQMLGPY